jgi:hypothetical protein
MVNTVAKRNHTSKPTVESNVGVVDVGTPDTLSDAELELLNQMIADDAVSTPDDADDESESESNDDNESESESTPETLSEMLQRLTDEKIAVIEKQKLDLENQMAAVLANVSSDAVRLVAVTMLNDGFDVGDLKLESGSTIGLALEYNVDSAMWSMAIDAVVKLPRVRTVASASDGSTAQNTIWFTSFTKPGGTKFDAPMLVKNDGTVSETRNDLAACALILGFDIKNNGQYTMNANAKQKRITENGWSFETAQNFQS